MPEFWMRATAQQSRVVKRSLHVVIVCKVNSDGTIKPPVPKVLYYTSGAIEDTSGAILAKYLFFSLINNLAPVINVNIAPGTPDWINIVVAIHNML